MGLLGESFIGNPNRLDEVDVDEIEYFLDDDETMMFGGQYVALDLIFDSGDDDDDDSLTDNIEDSLTDIVDDDDVDSCVILESDYDSQAENDDDSSQDSDVETMNTVEKKTNDVKSTENIDPNASQA